MQGLNLNFDSTHIQNSIQESKSPQNMELAKDSVSFLEMLNVIITKIIAIKINIIIVFFLFICSSLPFKYWESIINTFNYFPS